jgi:hypothetical protein
MRLQATKRVDDALGRLARFRQHDALALSAFEQLDDDRRAADERKQVLRVARRTRKSGHRQTDALSGEQLQ